MKGKVVCHMHGGKSIGAITSSGKQRARLGTGQK